LPEREDVMEPSVRYIVDDVAAAVAFYRALGFEDAGPSAAGFALLRGHGMRVLLNTPGAGAAGQPADDGGRPTSGGWTRVQVEVADVSEVIEQILDVGGRVRTSAVAGRGGVQAVVDDPSGNAVELFTPAD
jgi:predicted enzyme related to lactoylglutathione lyase